MPKREFFASGHRKFENTYGVQHQIYKMAK